MISKELRDKFKALYKQKYDVDLTDEETTAMTNDLVNLMKLLLRSKSKKGVTSSERTISESEQDETHKALQRQTTS